MGTTIYFIIFILFVFFILWTWNSTKEFEGIFTRISYIVIGTAFIALLTLVIFLFAKIGVEYPKQDMVGQVRRIILLIFTPINGFAVLPQVANIISRVKNGNISNEDLQKKIRVVLIICIVLIIFECIYFKNIQTGIIDLIKTKQ
jgi:hypothetical protein